jgi:agmatine deiminase
VIKAGHRFPGEFEPHAATWLLWPSRPDNWREAAYFGRQDTLALASYIAHFEPVRLGVPKGQASEIERSVPPNVRVVPMLFDDTWVRDTGPTVLVSNEARPVAVDWRFNSWGGLFSQSSLDDDVAQTIAQAEAFATVRGPIVLEGGAIVTDGRGTLIATAESILCSNRNPGLSQEDAEAVFREFLNITNVIWLPQGLANDESGGHIDNVCAFASERVLVVSSAPDPSHPSSERLRVAKDILRRARNTSNEQFELVEIPLPAPTAITAQEAAGFAAPAGTILRQAGCQLAPSHVNFYISNGAVFVPTFNSPTDDIALDILRKAFVGRAVVPFQSREFLLGGGAIHCLTREIPR